MDTDTLAKRASALALDLKALNVVIVDLRKRSSYADFLVIASGTSDRHVQSVADNIEVSLKKEGVKIVGAEGAREGQWALLDMGGVVVHVFHQFARDIYDLEALYDQAPRTRVTEAPPPEKAPAKPKAAKATAAKPTATKTTAAKATAAKSTAAKPAKPAKATATKTAPATTAAVKKPKAAKARQLS